MITTISVIKSAYFLNKKSVPGKAMKEMRVKTFTCEC